MDKLVAHTTTCLSAEQKAQYVQGLLYAQEQGVAPIPAMVTYQDIQGKGMLNYSGGMKIPKTVAHFGQRKLFLSELHFLTGYLKTRTSQLPILLVYPGAAPSKHTGYLATLFPEVTFVLVDPTAFAVKLPPRTDPPISLNALIPQPEGEGTSVTDPAAWAPLISEISLNSRIYTINGMFTDALAHALVAQFAQTADMVLVSDIRTNTAAYIPDDLDTCWNLAQQFLWVKILNPIAYLLKFRYPYFVDTSRGEDAKASSFIDRFNKCAGDELFADTFASSVAQGLDVVTDYAAQRMCYLPGTLDIQAFPGQNSTELRLSNLSYHSSDHLVEYPHWKSYEGEMCMFNKVWRPLMLHRNPYALRSLGFDHCNDCALEALFWEEYLSHRNIPITNKAIHERVFTLNRYSCGPLKVHNHGHWYGDYQAVLDQMLKYDGEIKASPSSGSGYNHYGGATSSYHPQR